MSALTSRQQRRSLDRYAADIDHITAEDRRWFERHPERRFRIRRMAAAEIGSAEAIQALKPLPQGTARFTLVRKVTDNFRLRCFIHGPAHKSGAEACDEVAAALWEHHLDRTRARASSTRRSAITTATRATRSSW